MSWTSSGGGRERQLRGALDLARRAGTAAPALGRRGAEGGRGRGRRRAAPRAGAASLGGAGARLPPRVSGAPAAPADEDASSAGADAPPARDRRRRPSAATRATTTPRRRAPPRRRQPRQRRGAAGAAARPCGCGKPACDARRRAAPANGGLGSGAGGARRRRRAASGRGSASARRRARPRAREAVVDLGIGERVTTAHGRPSGVGDGAVHARPGVGVARCRAPRRSRRCDSPPWNFRAIELALARVERGERGADGRAADGAVGVLVGRRRARRGLGVADQRRGALARGAARRARRCGRSRTASRAGCRCARRSDAPPVGALEGQRGDVLGRRAVAQQRHDVGVQVASASRGTAHRSSRSSSVRRSRAAMTVPMPTLRSAGRSITRAVRCAACRTLLLSSPPSPSLARRRAPPRGPRRRRARRSTTSPLPVGDGQRLRHGQAPRHDRHPRLDARLGQRPSERMYMRFRVQYFATPTRSGTTSDATATRAAARSARRATRRASRAATSAHAAAAGQTYRLRGKVTLRVAARAKVVRTRDASARRKGHKSTRRGPEGLQRRDLHDHALSACTSRRRTAAGRSR